MMRLWMTIMLRLEETSCSYQFFLPLHPFSFRACCPSSQLPSPSSYSLYLFRLWDILLSITSLHIQYKYRNIVCPTSLKKIQILYLICYDDECKCIFMRHRKDLLNSNPYNYAFWNNTVIWKRRSERFIIVISLAGVEHLIPPLS